MYKPDDNDIDRLSREAAEHYHAPGKPSWDALQQMLDKELPQQKEKKRRGFFFFWFLLLGILVAGAGIWLGTGINKNNKTITATKKTATDNKDNTSASTASAVIPSTNENNKPAVANASGTSTMPENNVAAVAVGSKAKGDNAGSKNKPVLATAITSAYATNKPPVTSNLPVKNKTHKPPITTGAGNAATNNTIAPNHTNNTIATKDKKGLAATNVKNKRLPNSGSNLPSDNTGVVNETAAIGKKKNVVSVTTGKKSHNTIAATGNAIAGSNKIKKNNNKAFTQKTSPTQVSADTPATETAADNNNEDKIKNEKVGIVQPAYKKDDQVTTAKDTAAVITSTKPIVPGPSAIKTEKKDSAVVAKKKNQSKKEKAFTIGLTAGFDFSTVKFTHGDNAGYNFGIMGGYQFSKHWSVYTGVIYTKKNYDLDSADWHPPKHYFTQYVDLQTVEGYCRMWEVPLQARYTFNPGAKSVFFASAGLSSYFMKKQGYDYYYKTAMGPMTANWATDTGFHHILSILDLSVGLQKKVGQNMDFLIEPYAKIPLGGVGFGNIRLSSFGVNLTIQYRRPVKR